MLPPFIIDQIRKREDSVRPERPRLEVPLSIPAPEDMDVPNEHAADPEERDRGIMIIEL